MKLLKLKLPKHLYVRKAYNISVNNMFGINIDVERHRKKFKFYGKLTTYWALVLALAGVVTGNIVMASSGLLFITIGCTMHEYSEN
jgi:hypothetical protein